MRRYLYIIALFVFVIVSCTPDEIGTPFVEGQEVTLTASVANSASSAKQLPGKQRVSGKDAGTTIALTWNAGDQILVRVGDKSSVFTLASGAGTDGGTFTGKMPADGTSYSVIYPTDYNENVLTNQTYVPNGFGNGLMKMSTKTNGTLDEGFVLSADNAVLGLQLTGNHTLGRIVLTNINTEKTYTLNCNGVTLQEDKSTLFYIVVPVEDWTNGMRLEVYDNDGDIILMKEKAGEIMFSVTDAMVMPSLQTRERGKRIGIFSVGEGKYVSFSQGNLQHVQSTKEWLFAENQQEHIGKDNIKGGRLADKIDLFGWSSDNPAAPFGISTSMKVDDYKGNFVDWGVNIIQGDKANTWRTLSVEEWGYLFKQRANANQLYSKGSVDDLRGMIVLPDDWVLPEGLQFTADPQNLTIELDINRYTKEEWQLMEEAGAVFFCPTGRRDGTIIDHLNHYGCYWSRSRTADKDHACHMYYNYSSSIFMTDYKSGDFSYGVNGRAVRLVHDTVPSVLTFTVNGVSFDMIYVEGGTFMMGATPEQIPEARDDEYPAHEVTLSSYYIAETELTQELWTALMGTTLHQHYENNGKPESALAGEGNQHPMYKINLEDCREFMDQLNLLTGNHFRLPTEAEWEYAARGGKYSQSYIYPGGNELEALAWYKENSNNLVHPVAKLMPNELGIYDMAGNVWEWVSDFYEKYPSEPQTNPRGSTTSTQSIVRGGSRAVSFGASDCRVSARNHSSSVRPDYRNFIGLRMVMEIK